MSNMLDSSGYSEEERFIHQKEAEKREELKKQREAAAKEQEKKSHWMKCPKCGSDMVEKELDNVMIDQCTECEGIYFDAGELELILKREESKSFMNKFKGFLKI